MHLLLRTVPLLLLLALAGAAPASAAGAAYPKVTKVSPLKVGIGDTLTLSGKALRAGSRRTTVVFKREGGRSVFVRATKATTRKVTLTVPAKLLPFLRRKAGVPQATRFRLRVLTTKLGRSWTATKASPVIRATSAATGNAADCDGDRILNTVETDDDDDKLLDVDEANLGTQSCSSDSDGDGMSDGWEHLSAVDRNGKALPSPKARPYPNALKAGDGEVDHDGDGLTNLEEYVAWAVGGRVVRGADADRFTSRLTYSGGNPNSDGRGQVPIAYAHGDRDGNGFLSDLERDADGDGFPNFDEARVSADGASTTDAARGPVDVAEPSLGDVGLFTPLYLETFGVALSKQAGLRCGGINQVPFYCFESYGGSATKVQKVDTLSFIEADTDGDTIRDDLDDVDNDDVPNMVEYLDELRSIPSGDRRFRHLDACIPNAGSRFCLLGSLDVDRDGQENGVDADDDGDRLGDALERALKTDPLLADTDGDAVIDGFEYLSGLDLNATVAPYGDVGFPIKRPYPNPLDKDDAGTDFDGDVLTLLEEQRAWLLTGTPTVPATPALSLGDRRYLLGYSDGRQATPALGTSAADARLAGPTTDDVKDVDGDGLSNYTEAHGPMSGPAWWGAWIADDRNKCHGEYVESEYPSVKFLGTLFDDADTDGDGVLDGPDDVDHDGWTNAQEGAAARNVLKPGWCASYVSTVHSGSDRLARVQPFNPCKPTYSVACHLHPKQGAYPANEDWESPHRESGTAVG
jgi:hypothetical protein